MGNMELEWIKLGWQIANTVINIMLCAWMILWRRSDKTMESIAELKTGLNVHGQRLQALETDMRHTPTHTDLGNMHEKINLVTQSNSRIEGILTQLNNRIAVMDEEIRSWHRR